MFRDVVERIGAEVSGRLAFQELKAVHEIDRWFTFSAFAESAAHIAARWQHCGLEQVEVESFAADGRSKAGSWTMPLAWDARDAVLTIEEPVHLAGTVIARYRETPSSLAMWSGPTPEEGVVADLVWIEDADRSRSYARRDVKGRIVFTSTRPVFMKGQASARGALGVVSDFVPHPPELQDENFWMNAWSDNPGGWGLHAGDSRIFGFNISPRKGAWLRELIRAHGRVRVRAVVDTSLYEGSIPTATAVIRGATPDEEVLILGHAFEQGANDNSSGVAVMLEAARVLSKLIAAGELPRPQRSIRFLAVSECYSTFAYCEKHADRMRSTLAALCVDSVAHRQDLCRAGLGVHHPPDANASFTSAFSERLAEWIFTPWRPTHHWKMLPYVTTDNVVADPMIGPPTMLLTAFPSDLYWHTTGDTPEKVDVDALEKVAQFAASYLYVIADAGSLHALYFGGLAAARAKSRLAAATARALEQCTSAQPDFPAAQQGVLYRAQVGAAEVESVRSMLTHRQVHSIAGELAEMAGELIDAGAKSVALLEKILCGCGVGLEGPAMSVRSRRLVSRAERLVPIRKYIGTMAYDSVDAEKLSRHPDMRWDEAVTAALFWCDGRRTLDEVLKLAGGELTRDLTALVEEFDFLAAEGLIEMRESS